MILDHLKSIFSHFDNTDALASYKELASGHINDTYLIKTEKEVSYILQRINHGVFKDVPGLISNKTNVSQHLLEKMSHLPADELSRRVLTFVPTTTGLYYHLDADKNYWNVMVFIHDSITYESVNDENVAYEGGKLIGNFLNLTDDFDSSVLIDVIPKFHDMSFRFEQFSDALQNASEERLSQAQAYIDIVDDLKEEMHIIQYLKEAGKIKMRVTHNDTKISNILFDQENKGLCVIDTDTVMDAQGWDQVIGGCTVLAQAVGDRGRATLVFSPRRPVLENAHSRLEVPGEDNEVLEFDDVAARVARHHAAVFPATDVSREETVDEAVTAPPPDGHHERGPQNGTLPSALATLDNTELCGSQPRVPVIITGDRTGFQERG